MTPTKKQFEEEVEYKRRTSGIKGSHGVKEEYFIDVINRGYDGK